VSAFHAILEATLILGGLFGAAAAFLHMHYAYMFLFCILILLMKWPFYEVARPED
jgi:hypothetical protein